MPDFGTLEQMFKVKQQTGANALKKAFDEKNLALQEQEQSLTDQMNHDLPKFQQMRDQAAVNAAGEGRKLNEYLDATGQYGGGTGYTRLAQIAGQKLAGINSADAQEGQLRSTFTNRFNQIRNQRTQNQNDFADQSKLLEDQIMAELTQAKQEAMARVSTPRSSGPSISALNRQDKLNAQDATAGALEALYRDAPNMTRAELKRAIGQMRGQWYRDGVDMKQVDMALEGVQTRDEIEAEQKAAYQEKLDARPWYQRAIDYVLPGSQWG